MRITSIAVSVLLAVAATAQARTWRVEKTGAGDFAVIQAALDAAADGDTIRIGPGQFTEVKSAPEIWTAPVVSGYIRQADLTIIGGGDQTVVGFPAYASPWPWGFVCENPAATLRLSSLTISGFYIGVLFEGTTLRAEDLTVRASYTSGLAIDGAQTADVVNCRFISNHRGSIVASRWPSASSSLSVRRCAFVAENWGMGAVQAGGTNCVIENCTVDGCTSGFHLSGDSRSVIANCVVSDCPGTPLSVGSGAHLDVTGSEFITRSTSQQNALHYGAGSLRARNCRFQGGSPTALFYLDRPQDIDIRECAFLNGGGQTLEVFRSGAGLDQPVVLDLTGNYWGTTNPAQLDAWITDYRDFHPLEGGHWAIVEYGLFYNAEQATESAAWGAVKSSFMR